MQTPLGLYPLVLILIQLKLKMINKRISLALKAFIVHEIAVYVQILLITRFSPYIIILIRAYH